MKKLLFIIPLIASIVFSSTVYAYDPENSGIEYRELQEYFYVNDDSISEIPEEVQEAWDSMKFYMMIFEKERTTVYYTSGIDPDERYMDNEYYNGYYASAKTEYVTGAKGSHGRAVRPGKIFLYADANNSNTTIHEYGHALYNIYHYRVGYRNKFADNWSKIYGKERKALIKYDNQSSYAAQKGKPHEGFAEAFRIYVVDSTWLWKNCPDTYDFMKKTISETKKFDFKD